MLFRELYEQNHCLFVDNPMDWQQAVRHSCTPLVEDGSVEPDYANEIIACIEEYGPYIVLIPGFAMPHTQQGSSKVHKTTMCFMKTAQPVVFDPEDPEKTARVFFTLAASDSDEHLKNMSRLFQLLSDEDLCLRLLELNSIDELLALDTDLEEEAHEKCK